MLLLKCASWLFSLDSTKTRYLTGSKFQHDAPSELVLTFSGNLSDNAVRANRKRDNLDACMRKNTKIYHIRFTRKYLFWKINVFAINIKLFMKTGSLLWYKWPSIKYVTGGQTCIKENSIPCLCSPFRIIPFIFSSLFHPMNLCLALG